MKILEGDQRRSSKEDSIKKLPAEVKGADMTPFQRKVINVTGCISTTFILGTFSVILVLALTNKSSYNFLKECRSADCLSEVRYLDALTDDAVDPCVDFYGHVCGRWNSLHGGGGFVQDAFRRFFDSLKRAVHRANPSDFDDMAQDHNLTYLIRGAPWDTPAGKTFLGSYIALRIVTQRETLLVRPPDAAEAELARMWAHPWPVYMEPQGSVVLPAAYLAKPLLYAGSAAPEANYATVGVALAKAFSEAIDPYSRLNVTSPGSFWSPVKRLDYGLKLQCFVHAVDPSSISEDHLRIRTNEHFRSQFVWMRAARIGLDMLRKAFVNGSKTASRSGTGWTRAQRIFFKRFCLLSCGSERGVQLSPQERCTWPLLTMSEFREVFQCKGNGTAERFASLCLSL